MNMEKSQICRESHDLEQIAHDAHKSLFRKKSFFFVSEHSMTQK